MQLQKVNPRPSFRVRCVACGKRWFSTDAPAYFDPQGPAFQAYYCEPCAQAVSK